VQRKRRHRQKHTRGGGGGGGGDSDEEERRQVGRRPSAADEGTAGQRPRQGTVVPDGAAEHDGRTDAVPVHDRVHTGHTGQPEPEHPKGVPGGTETGRGGVRRPGEQEQEQHRADGQRGHRAKAGGRHAHLADDIAEQRARRVRAVPGIVERP